MRWKNIFFFNLRLPVPSGQLCKAHIFWKGHKNMPKSIFFDATNVLGRSLIWTCRITNFEYLLLFPSGRRSWKKSKQIFEIRHVQIDDLATKDINMASVKNKIQKR